jgi:hypothetical protein
MGSKGITWPLVALALVAIGGVVAMFSLAGPQDRSAMLALLSAVTSAVVAGFLGHRLKSVDDKVDKVVTQTNGHSHEPESQNVTYHSGQSEVQSGQSTVAGQWIPYNVRHPEQPNDER